MIGGDELRGEGEGASVQRPDSSHVSGTLIDLSINITVQCSRATYNFSSTINIPVVLGTTIWCTMWINSLSKRSQVPLTLIDLSIKVTVLSPSAPRTSAIVCHSSSRWDHPTTRPLWHLSGPCNALIDFLITSRRPAIVSHSISRWGPTPPH